MRRHIALLVSSISILTQAEVIRLPQEPALSPDGSSLVFAWRGDVWEVGTKGGVARRLTQHSAVESSPAYSPDGQQIAFVSDRDGSKQVYVMPAKGGEPKQLTWHTEGYQIEEWFPDGKGLLVSITRDNFWKYANRLARLDVTTRKAEEVLLDDCATEGSVSPDGKQVLFTREGEVWWRQGYRGSRAGQTWMLNREDGRCRKIIGEVTETRWPLWKPDGKGFYHVASRKDGVFNLWELDLASGKNRQLTQFKTDSVVFPTLSRDGSMLVFRHQFDLYRLRTDGKSQPERIVIEEVGDVVQSPVDRTVMDRATSITFTDNGLQIAFVSGGDVWVMDTELKEPRQVTRTAEEERAVVFSPDAKALWFVSDAEGQTDIWKAEPANAKQFWWENRDFKLTRITNDAEVESRLQFSPDGKRLAYTRERGDLWLADGDGKNAKRLVESWNQPSFSFSPDGTWIVYSHSDEWFNSDIWLLPLDGSQPPFNLSRHPDNDESPVWSPDGKMIAWTGRRQGDEIDIYYAWVRAEDDEQTKRERVLAKAREKISKSQPPPVLVPAGKPAKPAVPTRAGTAEVKEEPKAAPQPPVKPEAKTADKPKEEDQPKGDAKKAAPAPKPKAAMKIDLDDIHERIRHISLPNMAEFGLVWSPDSKKLAFTVMRDEKQTATYTVEFPDDLRPKLLVPNSITQARWIKNNDQIVGLNEGTPVSVMTKTSPSVTTHRFKAQQSVVRAEKQRAVFDQCWRVMRDHYYDDRLGNRDWDAVRAKYAPVAAAMPDMRSVVEVVQLMLGELNGSHLGFTLEASSASSANTWKDETAHLGLRFDPTHAGPGWKVRDVLAKSPASQRQSRIEAGELILRVDDREVRPGMDVSEVLNGPPERDIGLRVKAVDGMEREVTLRPISYLAARKLLYEQWIKQNRAVVEQASKGTLGYLHITAMDDASFERFQEELYAAGAGKDGLVIDVRENGGGSTADHLLTALTQPRHAIAVPRGSPKAGYPQDRMVYATWSKPVVVLCNQNSYSNAEIFSHAMKTLKRGQVVGVPTAGGVISTGSTRIMDVGSLRLPFRGWFGLETGIDMELNGAVPDHVLWPQPGDWPKGIDTQLQKAIEVLTTDVAKWARRPQPKLLKASERKLP